MVFWVWEQTFFDVGGKNTQTDRFVWIREHIFFCGNWEFVSVSAKFVSKSGQVCFKTRRSRNDELNKPINAKLKSINRFQLMFRESIFVSFFQFSFIFKFIFVLFFSDVFLVAYSPPFGLRFIGIISVFAHYKQIDDVRVYMCVAILGCSDSRWPTTNKNPKCV